MAEHQAKYPPSNTMKAGRFNPAQFFGQNEVPLEKIETEIEPESMKPPPPPPSFFQHPFEAEVMIKRRKHAKTLKALRSLQAKWDEMFQRLVEYKILKGDCLVPNRYKVDPPLGSWVSTQRRQVCCWVSWWSYVCPSNFAHTSYSTRLC